MYHKIGDSHHDNPTALKATPTGYIVGWESVTTHHNHGSYKNGRDVTRSRHEKVIDVPEKLWQQLCELPKKDFETLEADQPCLILVGISEYGRCLYGIGKKHLYREVCHVHGGLAEGLSTAYPSFILLEEAEALPFFPEEIQREFRTLVEKWQRYK